MFCKILIACLALILAAATLTEAQRVHTLPYYPNRDRLNYQTQSNYPKLRPVVQTLPNYPSTNSGSVGTLRVRRDMETPSAPQHVAVPPAFKYPEGVQIEALPTEARRRPGHGNTLMRKQVVDQ